MNHLSLDELSPDFELQNHEGRIFRLSDLYNILNVLLVFNIGFI
jgi:peroxiredoxin